MADASNLPFVEDLLPKDFSIKAYIHNGRLAVVGPIWEFSPKISFSRFKEAYTRNPVAALRDYASQPPVVGKLRVYSDIQLVINRVDPERRGHPFHDGLQMHHWFRPRASARYVLRFDLSETRDHTGIALTHWDHNKQRIYLDFAMEITPQMMGGAIRVQTLENLVYTLLDRGFYISQVSMDKWGSVQARQNIEARGTTCVEYSVDRTTEAHETMYESIFSGVLSFYNYPPLFSNLQDLIWTKGGKKIDHTATGRKDVADAVAGAIAQALKLEGFQGVPEIYSVDVFHESKHKGPDADDLLAADEEPDESKIPAKEIVDDLGILFEDVDQSGDDLDEAELDPDDSGVAW